MRAGHEQPPQRGGRQLRVGPEDQDLVDLLFAHPRRGPGDGVVAAQTQREVGGGPGDGGERRPHRGEAGLHAAVRQVHPAQGDAGAHERHPRQGRIGAREEQVGGDAPGVLREVQQTGVVVDVGREEAQGPLHDEGRDQREQTGAQEQVPDPQAEEGDGQQEEHPVVDEDVVPRQHQEPQQEADQGDDRGTADLRPPGGGPPAPGVRGAPARGEGQAHPGQGREQGGRVTREQGPGQGRVPGVLVEEGKRVHGDHAEEGEPAGGVDAGEPAGRPGGPGGVAPGSFRRDTVGGGRPGRRRAFCGHAVPPRIDRFGHPCRSRPRPRPPARRPARARLSWTTGSRRTGARLSLLEQTRSGSPAREKPRTQGDGARQDCSWESSSAAFSARWRMRAYGSPKWSTPSR